MSSVSPTYLDPIRDPLRDRTGGNTPDGQSRKGPRRSKQKADLTLPASAPNTSSETKMMNEPTRPNEGGDNAHILDQRA